MLHLSSLRATLTLLSCSPHFRSTCSHLSTWTNSYIQPLIASTQLRPSYSPDSELEVRDATAKKQKKHVSWLVVETEKNRYRLDRCLFLKKGRQLLASKWNIHTQRRQKHSFEQKILQYFLVKHCDQNKPFFNFGGANIEIRQRAYQLLDILSIFIVGTLFSILPVRFGVAWPLAEIEDFASSN